MPDSAVDIGNKGFDILNKIADKTSPKYKSFNLVMLTIGILAVFLVIFIVTSLTEKEEEVPYLYLVIISGLSEVIYAVSFLIQDYLSIKRQQINMQAYNQQYQNRS